MITVLEAINKIELTTKPLEAMMTPLPDALGSIVSEDILSPINMPPFRQSAMDGYAVCIHSGEDYALIGEVKAGDSSSFQLSEGQAIRIFTGAMVPNGANAVVKQEDVNKLASSIQLTNSVNSGDNIRPLGEQIMEGSLALPKFTHLNPGAIGFLATLGLTHIPVFRKPKIVVIATGNELSKPGIPLTDGKIYESNTFTLQAALKKSGFDARIATVADDYEATKKMLAEGMEENDIVIVTGGISVGDYDFVGDALLEIGVTSDFYKIKQKPGKPIFFGHKEAKLVFALPGNPAAVLSCFYIYVLPCLQMQMGVSNFERQLVELTLQSAYKKTAKMTHFLKARSSNGEVEILSAQSSAMLSTFVQANCLVIMEQQRENWEVGDTVTAIMLPT